MTLLEAQIRLTELWPNYELVCGWAFERTGAHYHARWRPEGNMGLLSEYPVEIEGEVGTSMDNVLAELVEKATKWKEEMDAFKREHARSAPERQ